MLSAVLQTAIAIKVSIQIIKTTSTRKGIFFNGQIFDAYVFAAGIIKQA